MRRRLWTTVVASLAALAAHAVTGTGPAHAGRAGTEALRPLLRVRSRTRVVALTFDDGPDPRWTPVVLADLARHGDRATFFLLGKAVRAHPDLARAEVRAGEEVGNHSWNHPHLPALAPHAVDSQLARASRAIVGAGAPSPTLFRPPYGATDAEVEAAAARHGMRTVLWEVCLEHFVNHQPQNRALAELVERIRPGDIIVAHDGGVPNRARTLAALPPLLDELHAEGYQVVTVSELLARRAEGTLASSSA